MTNERRASDVKELSDRILEYLDRLGPTVDAGTLLSECCKGENVDPAQVELALLALLNDGSIETNHELELQKRLS